MCLFLMKKVAKDDIKIRFFEKKHDVVVWEDFGHFRQSDVHKGVAISFQTPPYKTRDIENSAKVNSVVKLLYSKRAITTEHLLSYFSVLFNFTNLPMTQQVMHCHSNIFQCI